MDEEKKKAAYNYINEYQKKNYDRITILRVPKINDIENFKNAIS